LRLSQRSLGVRLSECSARERTEGKKRRDSKEKPTGGKRKRPRRATARALTLAKRLRSPKRPVDVKAKHGENPEEAPTKDN